MKKIFIVIVFLQIQAFAHIEPGTYQGKKSDGSPCSMTAQAAYFENKTSHPLNERIKISVDQIDFTVGHPPIVDSSKPLVFFNHDQFQGIAPTKTGAQALVVTMNHAEGQEGPTDFTFMESKWKAKENTSYQCTGLKLNAVQ